jgi:hypothetical protein
MPSALWPRHLLVISVGEHRGSVVSNKNYTEQFRYIHKLLLDLFSLVRVVSFGKEVHTALVNFFRFFSLH